MTLASFGTKILSFLMVPLYTNILSTEAYGTYDIYQTTLFLIVPVLSLNIADGIMLRILAMLGIVIMHTNGAVMEHGSGAGFAWTQIENGIFNDQYD